VYRIERADPQRAGQSGRERYSAELNVWVEFSRLTDRQTDRQTALGKETAADFVLQLPPECV